MENIRTVGQLISELSKLNIDSPLVDVWGDIAIVTIEEVELEDLAIKGCHVDVISEDDLDELIDDYEDDYEDEGIIDKEDLNYFDESMESIDEND